MLPGEHSDPGTDERTAVLLAAVRELSGAPCRTCARVLCPHEAVLSVLLGYRNAVRCASCLAAESGETRAAFCERVLSWIEVRDCYELAWKAASRRENARDELRPACLFAERAAASAPAARAADGPAPLHAARFEAGDMACGELVLELRARLRALAPGAVLLVEARDPAAPLDLPAWCGLTRNPLLAARHPQYWIQRKPET